LYFLILTISVVQFMMETLSDLVIRTSSKQDGSPITKMASLMAALLLRDQSPHTLPHPSPLVICGVKSLTQAITPVPFPKPQMLAGSSFS
jgi:hypothetical protein